MGNSDRRAIVQIKDLENKRLIGNGHLNLIYCAVVSVQNPQGREKALELCGKAEQTGREEEDKDDGTAWLK